MSSVINKAILSLKVIRPELAITTHLERVNSHGEEDPWRVVVENLLDNSIRYATHEIVITLNERELTVANDGPLMSEERLSKLFKPYEERNGWQIRPWLVDRLPRLHDLRISGRGRESQQWRYL